MSGVIDSIKARALRMILERRSAPAPISRRAEWLRSGDARFSRTAAAARAARTAGTSRTQAFPRGHGEPGALVCAAVQMKMDTVASGPAFADLVYRYAAKAAAGGAWLVAFPEYSGLPLMGMIPGLSKTLASVTSLDDAAAAAGGEGLSVPDILRLIGPYVERAYREAFSSVARELGIYIVTGSMILPNHSQGEPALRSVGYVYNPHGGLAGTYSKAHLMPIEARWGVTPGDAVGTFDLGDAIVSVPVCMDATYFETFRLARFAGADIVVVPSANNEPYNLWYALRGIWPRVQESQVYGIGASMVGTFAGQTFTGRSSILAPLELTSGGDGVVAQSITSDEEEVVIGEIDLPLLYQYRAENPLRFNTHLYNKYMPELYEPAMATRRQQASPDRKQG